MQATSRASILIPILLLLSATACTPAGAADATPRTFTPLQRLPAPKIVTNAPAYPGGGHNAGNLLDDNPRSEYSSNGSGTNTFVEFDFGAPKRLAAIFHRDRNDPATIAASELVAIGADGNALEPVAIKHVNSRAGQTYFVLPEPITAQRVRWRVTALGSPQRYGTVGGAELAFYEAGQPDGTPTRLKVDTKVLGIVERKGDALTQTLRFQLDYPYAEPAEASLRLGTLPARTLRLGFGAQSLDVAVSAGDRERKFPMTLEVAGKALLRRDLPVPAPRPWEIHILPHSHVDIGYTALQADVEKKQDENLDIALRLIQTSRAYPSGSRFKWNVEVLWPVENYLRQAGPEKRTALLEAIKRGDVGLDAFYGNILTGLCRPEELLRLMTYATQLSQWCGVPVESAMISDVPGYTWSTVSAMAHAGVKYFSFAPNYFDRMGGTMVTWQDRPFYWVGPDGKSRVLCWCPSRGYALGHLIGDGEALARFLPDYLGELEAKQYPYDLTHLRWNVHGDNGSPDEKVAEVVRDWNARYAWPRLTISTTAATFREFERRYRRALPEFHGDYTPYWEDGAASSALETGLNRASAERLVQAETLWALRPPAPFPAAAFNDAWRNVLLYSEHTWGAHNSVSQPDLPFVKDQWKVKQAFALDADRQSRQLLLTALGGAVGSDSSGGIDVFNTCSWTRTDLVTLPRAMSKTGDRVVDDRGRAVPSQRLASGDLAFLASDVPALGARRFRIETGAPAAVAEAAHAEGLILTHPDFTVRISERTGAIASLRARSDNFELVDPGATTALNDYFYLPGADVKGVQRNGTPKITVKENGPLIASLLVESEAPGCRRLTREIRVIAGLDRIELVNVLDKTAVRAKEGVHFGFGFNVPAGTVRMDVGWAVVRPEVDQIPASCKNWFSVQRWVDIANERRGVTWATVDAPLVELGGLTANLIGSQTDPKVWISHLLPTQTIYSWVMNNHWHTNYRADQEGPTMFRYALRPHRGFSAIEAAKFGAAASQPLLPTPAAGSNPVEPALRVKGDGVLVTAFKPADDGKAWIVRLFGASGKAGKASLEWARPKPSRLFLSDTSEQPRQPLKGSVEVPAWGIVTVRAEL